MTTRYTLNLSDYGDSIPVGPNESIEAMLKEWNGRWIEAGVAAFDSEDDATGFANELSAMEAAKKAGRSRAPVNMQALGMLITATHASQKAKAAKTWFEHIGASTTFVSPTEIKMVVHRATAISGFTEAERFLQEAFTEHLPAIFEAGRKKAEEADRSARDQILHWGPKA